MQKILLAPGIKAVLPVLAFIGQATMWMVVLADMGASLLVGLAYILSQAQFIWLASRSA